MYINVHVLSVFGRRPLVKCHTKSVPLLFKSCYFCHHERTDPFLPHPSPFPWRGAAVSAIRIAVIASLPNLRLVMTASSSGSSIFLYTYNFWHVPYMALSVLSVTNHQHSLINLRLGLVRIIQCCHSHKLYVNAESCNRIQIKNGYFLFCKLWWKIIHFLLTVAVFEAVSVSVAVIELMLQPYWLFCHYKYETTWTQYLMNGWMATGQCSKRHFI